MVWIRNHVPYNAVLAVSNDRTPDTLPVAPFDVEYPAFTEHRTFREGWWYTQRAGDVGRSAVATGEKDPYPERTALENAVFTRGDANAMRVMAKRYGVTHIVVSKSDGPVSPLTYRLGRVVYSNSAVDVIEVSPRLTR